MKTVKNTLLRIVCLGIALFSVFPILWAIGTSFKSYIQTQMYPPIWVPDQLRWSNYAKLFDGAGSILPSLLNSLIIAVLTTVFVMLLAIPAAYSLARFKTERTQKIQFWIISLRMMPPVAAMIPLYILFSRLGLTNTIWGMVIVYTMVNATFAVWLLAVFFEGVPREVEEAAMIDGLSYFGSMIRILLALAANGVLVIAAFVFIFSWNELAFALVLTGQGSQTLPVVLSGYASDVSVQYQTMAATQIVQIIPVAVLTFLIQRNILTGLSFGAVKG
ncbi:carbohydrate ABC transporter permease [Paenibacillus macerans]|uniref:carbohydrate ABC transporter permease n=1 Tax=Paenibacillus macerans TaxID=44252 RepID=UPI002E21732D|nr:carbohydrate ABC transporter permease [Paenibacillus macerans]